MAICVSNRSYQSNTEDIFFRSYLKRIIKNISLKFTFSQDIEKGLHWFQIHLDIFSKFAKVIRHILALNPIQASIFQFVLSSFAIKLSVNSTARMYIFIPI
jgi:hypothetical protein